MLWSQRTYAGKKNNADDRVPPFPTPSADRPASCGRHDNVTGREKESWRATGVKWERNIFAERGRRGEERGQSSVLFLFFFYCCYYFFFLYLWLPNMWLSSVMLFLCLSQMEPAKVLGQQQTGEPCCIPLHHHHHHHHPPPPPRFNLSTFACAHHLLPAL